MPEGDEEPQTQPQLESQPATRSPAEAHTSAIKPNPVPTPKPAPKAVPWEIPGIQCYEPPDGVFYAQMGPTGGKQGYPAITGHVGWGISWYINGLLIPEIKVVRGKKYTFVVEGGSDPNVPARYHPFYITNDPVGGYFHKTDVEKKGIEIYAGVRRTRSGEMMPTGIGRLCNWTPDNEGPEADEYPSFGAYQRSLTLVCEEGNPGVVTWIPDKNTPDTVYYQCFTHRHLGWKIRVVDECDSTEAEESRVVESVALPSDLISEESIQVQNRINPNLNFLDQRKKIQKIINTKTNYNDFSSNKGDGILMGEMYPDIEQTQQYQSEQEYELPITNSQIKEVIQAVENLEDQFKDETANYNSSQSKLHQYQVYEDVKEQYLPEEPIRGDEYVVDSKKLPTTFVMSENQKPQTLHAVLRPNTPNKLMGNMRPPFRRPVPPEIKLRRPYPAYQKSNNGYPLSLPKSHSSHNTPKKPSKYPNNRPSPTGNRPIQLPSNIPPMKTMPSLYPPKPIPQQIPSKNGQKQTNLGQSIVMGKPAYGVSIPTHSQTLSLGKSELIGNQVVNSQIILPGINEPIGQHSTPHIYFNQPSQIVLGKPMDHPLPLDHHISEVKQFDVQTSSLAPEYSSYTTKTNEKHSIHNKESKNEMKSSDFIGQSKDSSTYQPAVNTGFKPDSIVIESGFKPIIREPLMAVEDKIADYAAVTANRREDTDVVEDYEESPQNINSNHAYSSEKQTQAFEPMFIPSPPDHLLTSDERTKEVFPKNHAKEDRPHPVFVKTESELNALFSKKNLEKDAPSDMMMESDRLRPSYLPPDPKQSREHIKFITLNDQVLTTYDGKTISAATLTTVPETTHMNSKIFSSKLPANTELLLRTPQFGPFKGKVPPQVMEHIKNSSSEAQNYKNTQTTHLKLVNSYNHKDDLKTEGSERNEDTFKVDDETEKDLEPIEDYEDLELEENLNKRKKRDIKTAKFERNENEDQKATTERKPGIDRINQMDFVSELEMNGSSRPLTNTWALPLTLFILWNTLF
ncbi:protein Skeletor, isoforms D/E isoform X2 [Leptidea sinapis]|nr:protein Skeletor, isoforms D/E isoform X2 [Leptidea sinapis]XP_050674871.1 protein Skeletor, isoforms D/E isoform X2 [Leptidea sinapis]XP_050674872.1 protein Skeletor, isoforms D/E isoform X2 [Leptidea sinapis]XP_050674873.1 protein Skeletor, isoforms D/E isoform X2 [Leptidea sinapis]XP_050674874.1 protein Skeletor, isoforms D/E isoform X2 [Leptidea sinapis]XP_050674875.1 protein Skeletor, isoforms D/E isoform X2 [Leptidea sinapis]